MTKERLKEVLEILSHYNNESFVDYYQLFGFNKEASIEEIKSQIKHKRLQVLFHPDQIGFIPSEYYGKYLNMIEVVKEVINTFDNYQNKEKYDKQLKESQVYSSNNTNTNDVNYSNNTTSTEWKNKTIDLDEVEFQKAIIITAEKYGFLFVVDAVYNYFQNNMLKGFTSTNNARNIMANLDRDKIKNLITQSSVNDNVSEIKNVRQIIMNYLTDLVYNTPTLKMKADCLEQACINTIKKYDLNGNYGQTKIALDRYYKIGDVSAFTNDHNVRMKLKYNVDYKDVIFFMQCSLNRKRHQDYKYAYENLIKLGSNMTQLYTDELIEKVTNYGNSNQYDEESYGR